MNGGFCGCDHTLCEISEISEERGIENTEVPKAKEVAEKFSGGAICEISEKRVDHKKQEMQQAQGHTIFLYNTLCEISEKMVPIDIGKNYLVTCSDMLMAYTHFPDEMSPYQIGQKVVTVNVSDLAAMGAGAIGILISMGLPRNMKLLEFDQIIDGILDACKKYNMSLIGGDTNESKELTLCGTCLGIVKKRSCHDETCSTSWEMF